MQPRALLLVAILCAGRLAAQPPQPPAAPGPQDTSLAARLERAERLLQLLREQVSQQARSRVEPRSGNRVELSGLVLVNAFFNNARVNNSDVPQLVLPPDPSLNLPASHAGGTVRQSQIALTASVPELFAGGSFHGELDLDFFGGQQASPGGRTWPLVRLRRVRADLEWPHGWVMFGQEAPPISEVNPSSLAQVGLVGFARAGNLWLWLPQVRAGAEVGTTVKIGIEGAVLAPSAGDPQGAAFFTQPDRAERARRPNFEARLRIRWDEAQGSGEVSLGGHYGWLAKNGDTLVASRAIAASARFTATKYLELRGEVFAGQALAGLGGGGIGQNLGLGAEPVRTRGGWAQLNVKPHPAIEIGGGYGLDDPDDADLDPTVALLRNLSWEGHFQWRPAPLVLGAEFRRIETTYGPAFGAWFAHHVNVAAGFEF